jgi:glucuronokinase
MDFRRDLMETRGYGEYESIDARLLPNVYLAYRTSLSEGTEIFHNNVRERWRTGDPIIVNAMQTWASYAERGRDALLTGNHAEFKRLLDANFDLRAQIYSISEGNMEMIRLARSAGATANFSGSGGAIAGTYEDDAMFDRLRSALSPAGIAVVKPVIARTVQASGAAE